MYCHRNNYINIVSKSQTPINLRQHDKKVLKNKPSMYEIHNYRLYHQLSNIRQIRQVELSMTDVNNLLEILIPNLNPKIKNSINSSNSGVVVKSVNMSLKLLRHSNIMKRRELNHLYIFYESQHIY